MTGQWALILLGVVTGLGAGGGAVLFRWLIRTFTHLFFDSGASLFAFMGSYYVIVLPIIGGAIIGPMICFLAPEAKGHGVPEIMEAVAIRGGRIRARVAAVKSLASSICIGSGGSVGREGPIAQIGSALGSTLAQLLHMSDIRTRTLVACGAGGGIAATFNAPLGGAFFALELILGRWTAEAFAPVVIATVTAAAIGRSIFGDVPSFAVPEYSISSFIELPAFLLLGLLAAPVAVALTRMITLAEDLFEAIPLPPYVLPAIGGLLVGCVGLYDHTLYGVGYGKIQELLTGGTSPLLWSLLLLASLKILATSTTLGSGGSGGVFSPSLYLGAALGAGFGILLHRVMPGMTTVPPAYALVGMGAVFAAASHAPITSVLIVFELTADYRMMLPLMVACGTSVLTARAMYRFSIYNIKLVRRGVHVQLGHDVNLLNDIKVEDAMTTDVVTVLPETPLRELLKLSEHSTCDAFPLADAQQRLHGLITCDEVRRAVSDGHLDDPVSSLATHRLIVAFPHETLNDALRKLGLHDVAQIPVVDPEDHTRLVGMITRKDTVTAYNRALVRAHTALEETAKTELFE